MGAGLDKDAEEFEPPSSNGVQEDLTHSTIQAATAQLAIRRHISIDPSLKEFLAFAYMSGLEYRLRLAGILTLLDLANHTEMQLSRKGLTELMARRLMRALDDYLANPPDEEQIPRSAELKTPFEIVRPNAVLRTTPSTVVRQMKNYGKRGVKRHTTSGVPRPQTPVTIRLQLDKTPFTLFEDTDFAGQAEDDMRLYVREVLSCSSVPLERSLSLPDGLHLSGMVSKPTLKSYQLQASHSSPALLGQEEEEEEERVAVASSSLSSLVKGLDEIEVPDRMVQQLKTLLHIVKEKGLHEAKEEEDIIRAVSAAATVHIGHPVTVELVFRLLWSVTSVGQANLSADTAVNVATSVLAVLREHIKNRTVVCNGCLTLATLCSYDNSVLQNIDVRSALYTLIELLKESQTDEVCILSILAALSTIASSGVGPIAQLLESDQFQSCVQLTAAAIAQCISSHVLVHQGLSLLVVGLEEGSEQLSGPVVGSVVASSCAVLQECADDPHSVLLACRVLASLLKHKEGIADCVNIPGDLVPKLLTAIQHHQTSSSIQMWASYVIYQAIRRDKCLLTVVKENSVIKHYQAHISLLPQDAQHYLQSLINLALLA